MAPQVTLYAKGIAPNPPKVGLLLEELGIEYNLVQREWGDGPNGVKAEDFLKINPNGRVPALVDHTNNDLVVWESGAILLYVAERFDNERKYIGKTLEEKAEVWQWLMFQLSGLGPMQGQHHWFTLAHPVKGLDQSVYDRYRNETYRLYGVLEKQLEKHDWVAINKFTVADMAIYPWVVFAAKGLAGLELTKFPRLAGYIERIKALPSAVKVSEKFTA